MEPATDMQGVSCLRRTSQAVCHVSTLVLSLQKYRDAAMIELEALNTLAANDPAQECHCVQLLEWFDYRCGPSVVAAELPGVSPAWHVLCASFAVEELLLRTRVWYARTWPAHLVLGCAAHCKLCI